MGISIDRFCRLRLEILFLVAKREEWRYSLRRLNLLELVEPPTKTRAKWNGVDTFWQWEETIFGRTSGYNVVSSVLTENNVWMSTRIWNSVDCKWQYLILFNSESHRHLSSPFRFRPWQLLNVVAYAGVRGNCLQIINVCLEGKRDVDEIRGKRMSSFSIEKGPFRRWTEISWTPAFLTKLGSIEKLRKIRYMPPTLTVNFAGGIPVGGWFAT